MHLQLLDVSNNWGAVHAEAVFFYLSEHFCVLSEAFHGLSEAFVILSKTFQDLSEKFNKKISRCLGIC